MPIISIIGFGSLGALFASELAPHLPFDPSLPSNKLRIIADSERVERYRQQDVIVNDTPITLNFLTPEDCQNLTPSTADLVIVCCKFHQLNDILPLIASQLGENTLIVSALNGIASERVLAQAFGEHRIVYCVAQQMDARKVGNHLHYRDAGQLVIGAMTDNPSEKANVAKVATIFTQAQFPHSVSEDMPRQLWGKLMLNVGVNQTVAVYQGTFATVQQEGEAREMFKSAMREVMQVANAEGIPLTEADFEKWVAIMDALDPKGMPSMRQDLLAKRRCELDLFAGTICELGRKHGIATPTNDFLFAKIREMMTSFS